MSMNLVINGSGNGLLPVWCQAVYYLSNVDLFIVNQTPYEQTSMKYDLIQGSAFESVVCKMSAILFRSPCIKKNLQQS